VPPASSRPVRQLVCFSSGPITFDARVNGLCGCFFFFFCPHPWFFSIFLWLPVPVCHCHFVLHTVLEHFPACVPFQLGQSSVLHPFPLLSRQNKAICSYHLIKMRFLTPLSVRFCPPRCPLILYFPFFLCPFLPLPPRILLRFYQQSPLPPVYHSCAHLRNESQESTADPSTIKSQNWPLPCFVFHSTRHVVVSFLMRDLNRSSPAEPYEF